MGKKKKQTTPSKVLELLSQKKSNNNKIQTHINFQTLTFIYLLAQFDIELSSHVIFHYPSPEKWEVSSYAYL